MVNIDYALIDYTLDDIDVKIDFHLRNSDCVEEFLKNCILSFLSHGESEKNLPRIVCEGIMIERDYESDLLELWWEKYKRFNNKVPS